jgi:two-component system chemotaxis sensor kinase CheA
VVNIVVLQAEDRQFGLVVDSINDTQEIVVKPLSKQLKGLTVYAGATIMGDGRVALILDVLGIGQRSGVLAESREARAAVEQKAQAASERQRLLLFRAGSFERLAVPLSLVARLEEFPLSSIERAGGRQVVQYRDRILPLVPLRAVLESSAPDPEPPADPAQVIVFNDGERSVGMMVDQILDVAEEAVTVRQKTNCPGLLGSGVVGKRVADFLDLNYVIHTYAADWFDGAREPSAPSRRVLVAEASAFSRGLIRSGLDMAGYHVYEAANLEEALRGLEQQPVDVVVTALDLPPRGSSALIEAMRRRPEWKRTPVLTLVGSAERLAQTKPIEGAFQDCQVKFDRVAMLESISRLAYAVALEHESEPVHAGGEK